MKPGISGVGLQGRRSSLDLPSSESVLHTLSSMVLHTNGHEIRHREPLLLLSLRARFPIVSAARVQLGSSLRYICSWAVLQSRIAFDWLHAMTLQLRTSRSISRSPLPRARLARWCTGHIASPAATASAVLLELPGPFQLAPAARHVGRVDAPDAGAAQRAGRGRAEGQIPPLPKGRGGTTSDEDDDTSSSTTRAAAAHDGIPCATGGTSPNRAGSRSSRSARRSSSRLGLLGWFSRQRVRVLLLLSRSCASGSGTEAPEEQHTTGSTGGTEAGGATLSTLSGLASA